MIGNTLLTPSSNLLSSFSGRANTPVQPPSEESIPSRGRSVELVQLSSRGLSLSTSTVEEVVAPAAQQRANQSANVILGFIGLHITRLAEEGASEEELAQALTEGLEGFRRGFAEATTILRDLGVLTGDLSDELEATEQGVLEGIESLRQRFAPNSDLGLDGELGSAATTTTVTGFESRTAVSRVSGANQGAIQAQFAAFSESYQQAQLANLEIVTRDGDRVVVNYESLVASQQQGAVARTGNGTVAGFAATQFQGFDFAISVTGELDEGEREALNQLLEQTRVLADEFFNGDFSQAFELAAQLELDTTELTSFSIDLRQTTAYTAAASYGEIQQLGGFDPNSRIGSLGQLGQIANRLIEALQTANRFNDPTRLLSDLLANDAAQRSLVNPERDFEPLLAQLDSLFEGINRDSAA